MKDKDERILNTLSDEIMLDDLQKLLNEELARPVDERDYDKISEITSAISVIADAEDVKAPSADVILCKVAEQKRNRMCHIRRWVAALSACFAVVVGINGYTMSSFGENIIETIVRHTKDGFILDLSAKQQGGDVNVTTSSAAVSTDLTTTSLTTSDTEITTTAAQTTLSNDDPTLVVGYMADKISEICGEHNVSPYVPSALPEEMVYNGFFELVDSHYEHMEDSDDFYFTFNNGNEQQVSVTLEKYKSAEDLPEILIPSDNFKMVEGEENGIHVYAFPDRNRTTAVFVLDNISYTINGYNISTDAIMKLAYSFVPSNADIK